MQSPHGFGHVFPYREDTYEDPYFSGDMRDRLSPISEKDEFETTPSPSPPPNRHHSAGSTTNTQAWSGFAIIPVTAGGYWQGGSGTTPAPEDEEEGTRWNGFDIIPPWAGGYYLSGAQGQPAWNGHDIPGADDEHQVRIRYGMWPGNNSNGRSMGQDDDEGTRGRGNEDMRDERRVEPDDLEDELDGIMDNTFIQDLLKGDPHSPVTRLDMQRFLIKLFGKKHAQSNQREANPGNIGNGSNNKHACCDPVPRDDDRKLLQASFVLNFALVRFHMAKLMDRETFRSAITAAAVNVVKAFSLRRGEGPVLKPMLPDLTDKSIHSKWNVRLGELFVNDFLRIGWADEGDASVVTELFFTHLVHLRRTYQAQLLVAENGGELTQTQRDNARAIARVNRRRYLRDRRAEACRQDRDLSHFASLWDNIPYTAVSDDEEDYDRQGKEHLIALGMPWRSAEAEEWMVRLDHVHMSTRWNAKGTPKRGNLPRWRVRGSTRMEIHCEPPRGLPENFYDARWLNELMEVDREALEATERVELGLSDRIMDISTRYRNVRDRTTPPNLTV